jgi:hypothetical protein
MRRVAPSELASHWPFVEQGLNIAASHGDESWTPKHVHDRIFDERAALYVRDEGFVVLEQCVHPISKAKYLNAWIAWFAAGEGKKRLHELVAWLDAMKQAHGCAWIEFSSPREGWEGLRPYFKPALTIWRRA